MKMSKINTFKKSPLKCTIKEKGETIPNPFENEKLSPSRRSGGLLDFENGYPDIFTSGTAEKLLDLGWLPEIFINTEDNDNDY